MKAARPVVLTALSVCTLSATTVVEGHSPRRSLCTIVASRSGPEWSLSLRIENGRAPAVIRYFAPLMLRGFTVRLGASQLSVAEPAIDMPVNPQALRLSPRQRATLPVITRLRFRPTSGPLLSDDRFVHTIDHAPTRVSLAGLFGEGPGAIACTGTLDPNGPPVP